MSAVSDAILALSPAGYWRLGETSGSVAADSSGNSRDGSYNGTYTLGADSLVPSDTDDKALGLSSAGYVSVPNAAAIDIGASFTFFCRFLRNTNTTNSTLFHKGDFGVSGNQGVNLYVKSGTNDVVVYWYNGSWFDLAFSGVFSLSTAHTLAFIYDGATTIKLIVDGTNVYTNTIPAAFPSNSQALTIGAATLNGTKYPDVNGTIDECAWFSGALSNSDIANIHDIIVDATPKYKIQSGSALLFNTGSRFSFSGSSDFLPQTSRRELSIGTGSSVVFNTDQRHFAIESGSYILPRVGAMFSFATESALNFSIQHTGSALAEIHGASSFAGESRSLFLSDTKIKTSSTPRMKGGYNAMTRAVISCRSLVRADYSTLSKSMFSSGASSSPIFACKLARQAIYLIGASSLVSPKASVAKPAESHPFGGSFISLSGIGAKQSAFSLSGHAALQFYSNYTTTPLPTADFEDVVFVKTAPISVFVRQ